MTKKNECNLCGGEHGKWWDCPNLTTKANIFGRRKKNFSYGFTVKGGTPKGSGRQQ